MKITVVREDVIKSDIPMKELTSDCHFVHLMDGTIDIVRGASMVKIFDYYHDQGKKITAIEVSGGQRNPKLQEPLIKEEDK